MFDLIFILLLLLNVFLGFRYGLFRRVVHFAAGYVGILLASYVSPGVSTFLGYNTGTHPADSHFGIFIAIVVALVILIEIIIAAFGDTFSFMNGLVFDRFFGAIAGFVFLALELSVLLYLFESGLMQTALPSGGHSSVVAQSQSQLDDSLVAKGLRALKPVSTFIYLPVLPAEPQSYFAKTYS